MSEPLFNAKTVSRLCRDVKVTEDQKNAAETWLDRIESGQLKKETNNYVWFFDIILRRILGYAVEDHRFEENHIEFTLTGSDGNELTCIEIKGSDVTDLTRRQHRAKKEHTTPIQQLWNYMGGMKAPYGVCTNYVEVHLMTRCSGYHRRHIFDFRWLKTDPERLREFIGMFSRDRLESGFVDTVSAESEKQEHDLTDEFYGLYGATRLMLVREFEAYGATRSEAVGHAQTFLNRIIFILFAEAHGLIEARHMSLSNDIMRVLDGPIGGNTKKLWRHLTEDLFGWLNEGSDDPRLFAFNGGLFSEPIPPSTFFLDKRGDRLFADIYVDEPQHTPEQRDFLDRHRGINPIIVNLLSIASYDFRSDIRVTILGHIFEHSIQEIENLLGSRDSTRKRKGIFYTPEYVTRFICHNTIIPCLSVSGNAVTVEDLIDEYGDDIGILERRLNEIRILDPACGSGAFLIEAANTLRDVHGAVWDYKVQTGAVKSTGLTAVMEQQRIKRIVRDNIYGLDSSEQSVGLTMLSLFLLTAFEVEKLPVLSDRIVATDSVKPDLLLWEDAFGDVFREHGGFDVIIGNPPYVRQEELENKAARQMPKGHGATVPNDFSIESKSDLSSYFYYHSICRLRPGGILGFIASDAWLYRKYGVPLQQFLLDNTGISTILRTSFKVFKDADVKPAVTLLKMGAPASHTRFAMINGPDEFQTGQFSYSSSVEQESLGVGNWNRYFMEPDTVPDKMIRMDKAGRVWRGVTTGHDGFFLLRSDDAKEHGIDQGYLVPTLPENMPSGQLAETDKDLYLLNVQDTKGHLSRTAAGRRVLEYIKAGEKMLVVPKKGADRTPRPISELTTMQARKQWYSLKIHHNSSVFLGRIIDMRPKVYENNGTFHAKDNFACFEPNEPLHASAFLAFMSSTWFALQAERNGSRSGAGALQLLINTCKALPVPDFGSLPEDVVRNMGAAWTAFREDQDQRKLDDAVFAAIEIDGAGRNAIEAEHAEAVEARRTIRSGS